MARCAIFDGRNGFYSVGGAELICSEYTCGSQGHAEYGCKRCCPSTTPGQIFSTMQPSMQPVLSSGEKQLNLLQIILIAVGIVSFLATLLFLFKRWKSRRMPPPIRCARDLENHESTEMMAVADQDIAAPSAGPLQIPLPITEHGTIEAGTLVESDRSDVVIDIPAADRERLLGPTTSATCIPTQVADEQRQTKKNYVPEGSVKSDSDDEEEGS